MDTFTYPNLNADSYRQLTPADRSSVPVNHLQFIIVNKENNAVLGESNLTDLWQGGTLWFYNNNLTNFEKDKCYISTRTDSSVTAGAFLEENKFVVAEDSGNLHILGLVENQDEAKESLKVPELLVLESTCQHDDSLTTLSVFPDNVHIVTGGMDSCIKLWDATGMLAMHSFTYAHTHIVTCVDAKPEGQTIFASSSLDNEALLWDVRLPKPANRILKKDGVGLTAVAWKKHADNILAVGALDGSITVVDVRNTSPLKESLLFPRGIHKITFNPKAERSDELAACCDDVITKVIDTSKEMTTIYEDKSSRDFVRGLAWTENFLLSCAWDGTVQKHVI